MSHYEERLEKDLNWIKELVHDIGETVEDAVAQAMRALITQDPDLAADTIIGDLLINRQTRELDRLCHVFVARHLPSAGHLRYVSSVLRFSIAVERVGDYSETISRTAVQLTKPPPAQVVRDLEMMFEQARRLFHQALKAFNKQDPVLAQSTIGTIRNIASTFDKVFSDMAAVADKGARPIADLFSLMATINRLERIMHQSKNICEETLFAATGQTKPEKTFHILFVDQDNAGASQLAEHFTRKAFPQSGIYESAGWQPAEDVDKHFIEFGKELGLNLADAWPTSLQSLAQQFSDYNLIVALSPDAREPIGQVPFHTTVLVWDIDPSLPPEEAHRTLAPRIRELMERLRGEEAS